MWKSAVAESRQVETNEQRVGAAARVYVWCRIIIAEVRRDMYEVSLSIFGERLLSIETLTVA